MNNANVSFLIRNVPIQGKVVLAPMAGVSDSPFRMLAREMGSAMSYTEFVNAMDVVNGHPYLVDNRLAYSEVERPIVFQLFDNEIERLIRAAQIVRKRQPDIIDINMGCSAKSVSGRGAGAGLLREPRKVAELFNRLSSEIDIPVTGKIRLGWDNNSINYLEIARIIQDNGGNLVAVHARTKYQEYGGAAEWDAIAEIKQSLSIPVIGNGDVKTVDDINAMLNYTNCDAVMIGRAALGNPWIFSWRNRNEIQHSEVLRVIQKHLHSMTDFYGDEKGVILFRKHLHRYLAPYNISRMQRMRILTATDVGQIIMECVAVLAESAPP